MVVRCDTAAAGLSPTLTNPTPTLSRLSLILHPPLASLTHPAPSSRTTHTLGRSPTLFLPLSHVLLMVITHDAIRQKTNCRRDAYLATLLDWRCSQNRPQHTRLPSICRCATSVSAASVAHASVIHVSHDGRRWRNMQLRRETMSTRMFDIN